MKELINIQKELKAPKNQYNKFGGYNYRSLEDIFEALKPLLEKNNVALTVSDEIVNIGDRFYVKATARLWKEDKLIAENTAYAREAENKKGMDESQITGATSSYARKYCLNGLFCIDDVKDADALNTHDKEEPKKAYQKPDTSMQRSIDFVNEFKTAGIEVEWADILKKYKVKRLGELTEAQMDEIRKELLC